jgi:L-alanine-DL-glutamate epimerase-like enolase superfamily enzyme
VGLAAAMRNAEISFDDMTASAIVIVSDLVRNGRPVVGLAFDSIGRYGHGGLLRERFIPRLLAASPETYADARGGIDPLRAWSVLMQNEKSGGHGERPGAVGLLDAALWDLTARVEEKPLWTVLAERFGTTATRNVAVYASGGHYRGDDDLAALTGEIRACLDAGHRRFKLKIAGAPLEQDRRRIEAALKLVDANRLAVDATAGLDEKTAPAWFEALRHYGLAWIEEPVDPLDFELHRELACAFAVPIATGENLFSAADTRNLLRYGGLRPDRDWLQMDVSLSYGAEGYRRILAQAERHGFSAQRFLPHAGHLFALHVVAGLALGGHETAADPDTLISGFPAGITLRDGAVTMDDAPGVGLERLPRMADVFAPLLP